MRIVFLGTPEFAVPSLRALAGDRRFEVVLVVTQPDRPAGRGRSPRPSPVKQFAAEANLPVLQPRRLASDEALAALTRARADVFVIAAYGQLLRPAVLRLPRHGCLNVHPSLLPRHRGAAPVASAILAGDAVTGVTIMLTDEGMDTGPILARETMPIDGLDTSATLTPRLARLGADLLRATLPEWVAGRIVPRQQDEAAATTSRLFSREDGAIDWSRGAAELARQVRALNPWPRAFTFHAGRRLLLLNARASAAPQSLSASPGTVLGADLAALRVATGAGELYVLEAQVAGRRPVAGGLLLRDGFVTTGDRLTPHEGSAQLETERGG